MKMNRLLIDASSATGAAAMLALAATPSTAIDSANSFDAEAAPAATSRSVEAYTVPALLFWFTQSRRKSLSRKHLMLRSNP
jgi:hypothetical protein